MGAVYEAVDERLDKTVALKETLFTEERLRKQFEREARLLARLHHPALPGVSDHFAEGEGEFLVMQYIAGDDLSSMIEHRRGPFPPEQVTTWADQLLDAVDYLHTQDPQIIHRDIKPQNLKLAARGQIILLDFGLAKGQVTGLSQVTTAASIFGYTPNYAPLEQVQGLGTDPRSDLYALAATLYHLLTGHKPPDALTRAAALVNGQPDPLQNANEVNPAVDPDVAAVLQRAMAQNRDQRYATATEMRTALAGADEAATVVHNSEVATVLFSTAPTAIPVATQTQRVTVAQTAQPAAMAVPAPVATPKKRIGHWEMAAAALVLLASGVGVFYAYQHRNDSASVTAPAKPQTPIPSAASEAEDNSNDATSAKREAASEMPARKEPVARKTEQPSDQKPANENQGERKAAVQPPPALPQPSPAAQPTRVTAAEPDADPDAQRGPNGLGRRRTPNGGTVRTFPDGTRVVVTPNGTRIVTFPDGSTRVFRPGEKINRRP
jgi:hypothetical protein